MSKKLLKFQIILDRDSLLYLPGQVLAGRVLLETQENTAVLGEQKRWGELSWNAERGWDLEG